METFLIKPIISLKITRKLSSYPEHTKIYPIKNKVGSCCCKKRRCQLFFNANKTRIVFLSVTKEIYRINQNQSELIICDGKCLIYLLT